MVVDDLGRHLKPAEYGFLRPVTIQELHIRRESLTTYQCDAPMTAKRWTANRVSKLKTWIVAIILCSPEIPVGKTLKVGSDVKLREQPSLRRDYTWTSEGDGQAIDITQQPDLGCSRIKLKRRAGGLLWDVATSSADDDTIADASTLQAYGNSRGITFTAHPHTTTFPWSWPERVCSRNGPRGADKQRKRQPRQHLYGTTKSQTDRMARAASQHDWDRHLQEQSVAQLWKHNNSVTAYQAWTWYRASLQQLNLHYDGKPSDGRCQVDDDCQAKESIAHIVWEVTEPLKCGDGSLAGGPVAR